MIKKKLVSLIDKLRLDLIKKTSKEKVIPPQLKEKDYIFFEGSWFHVFFVKPPKSNNDSYLLVVRPFFQEKHKCLSLQPTFTLERSCRR